MQYINNYEFLEELENSFEKNELTNSAKNMILKIIETAVNKTDFKNIQNTDESIEKTKESCFKNWVNFNLKSGVKPFLYFSQLVWVELNKYAIRA
jgi:hypothetical protein